MMAFHKTVQMSFRRFHCAVRYLSEDDFNLTHIIKSNSAQRGFNGVNKKQVKSVKSCRSESKQKASSKENNTSPDDNHFEPLQKDSGVNVTQEKQGQSTNDTTTDAKSVRKVKPKAQVEVSVSDENKIGSTNDTHAKTKRKNAPKPQKDINGERYKVHIPEWMNVVLECPSNSIDEVDAGQLAQFKDFIEELEIRNLPSVTTIIKKTEPEAQAKVLRNWTKRKTKELGGEEQFQEYRQKLFTRGSSLHDYIERYLTGEREFEVESRIEGPWESVQHVLMDISDVKKTEKIIVHPDLFYKGQLDCLATYRDEISLVEWKVSSKPKIMLSQTYDNPLQVAAYVGALNRSGILNRLKVPSIRTGVLVIAYEDGEPASVHVMNERICNKYWGRWKERLYHYWALQYQERMTSSSI